MEIESVVVGNGPITSMLVLRPRDAKGDTAATQLPIRIGVAEATQISAGVDGTAHKRPMTHDLLASAIQELGGSVSSVSIDRVEGTTFFATVHLRTRDGERTQVDARPSDAIALAVRTHSPVYADSSVLSAAAYPAFASIRRDEQEREFEKFHEFVDALDPDDFLAGDEAEGNKQ